MPTSIDAIGRYVAIREAGELVRASDGADASLLPTRMVAAQLWLTECPDSLAARDRIETLAGELLQIGMEALPNGCMPLGCIPALDVRHHGAGIIEVILYSECADALGRSAIEAAGRALASPLARLAGARQNPQIQIGILEALRARVRGRVDLRYLADRLRPEAAATASARSTSPAALDELLRCFGFDSYHPRLAAEHNDYVLGASMATAAALGLEPWRIGHAARSHAMRWGSCELLAKWQRHGGELHGHLEMPVDLASVCRGLGPSATGVRDEHSERQVAGDLLLKVASVGLAASLAYLRLVLTAHALLPPRSAYPSAFRPRVASPLPDGATRVE